MLNSLKYSENYIVFVHLQKNHRPMPYMQPPLNRVVFKTNSSIMRKLIFVLLILSGTTAHAQQSEIRSIGAFRGIQASEGIDVYLKQGEKEGVKVEVSGIPLKNVLTELSGDFLKIHLADGRYSGNRTVKVYVTYVTLTKLGASSAANIYSEGTVKTKSMALNASSAATIEISIDVENLKAGASSAADIKVKGKASVASIEASSAGEVDAYDLVAEEASLGASSAGTIKISVTQRIDARASSGGSIRYRGNPEKTNTNSSSGGSVKKS